MLEETTMCQIRGKAVKKLRYFFGFDVVALAKELSTTTEVIDYWEASSELDCEDQYEIATFAEKRGITREMLLEWSR